MNKENAFFNPTLLNCTCRKTTMETFVSLILKPNSVVVLDRTGKVRFRYDGTPARSKQWFNPGCIVTDCLGQITVTDSNNECLHILDQNGQFLKCLVGCSLENPLVLVWMVWEGYGLDLVVQEK